MRKQKKAGGRKAKPWIKRRRQRPSLGEKRIVRVKKKPVKRLSEEEKRKAEEQERAAIEDSWITIKRESLDADSLSEIESWHKVDFSTILRRIRRRFPRQRLEILNEGAGRSSLKKELLKPEFGGNMHVTTTDVRSKVRPDEVVNVLELVKRFGENHFHFIVSSRGGMLYSPFPERALQQAVDVLKPNGIGVVSLGKIPKRRMKNIEGKFGIKILQWHAGAIVFTKLPKRKM